MDRLEAAEVEEDKGGEVALEGPVEMEELFPGAAVRAQPQLKLEEAEMVPTEETVAIPEMEDAEVLEEVEVQLNREAEEDRKEVEGSVEGDGMT